MLEEILREMSNWFKIADFGDNYTVKDGSITLPFLRTNQYFRICGSVFNDGLHQYPCDDLADEEFEGSVWALAIPKGVIDLAAEIEEWQNENGKAAFSPYTSESFGGYSYNRDTSVTGWQDVFRSRLNKWRKLKGVER